MMRNIIGIDIGGSHITMAQVHPENHAIISGTYLREYIDSFAEKETIVSAWIIAIEKVIEGLNRDELIIGIAIPGPFDYKNGISLMKQGKFISLLNSNIREEMAKRLSLSQEQIHFTNDAAAFLEGEIFVSRVKNKRIFGVTLGTGLGTTFFDGNNITDENLWNSPFRDSIFEDYLATRWFVKRYKEMSGKDISGTKELLEKSKEIRTKIFDEYADSLSEFIIKYTQKYNIEILIIGGNIAKTYAYFKERFNHNLMNNGIGIFVKISEIFEDAAILGAASYALKKTKNQSK